MNYFWFKKSLKDAITMPRVHDQLYPQYVFAETRFPAPIVTGLQRLGHKVGRLLLLLIIAFRCGYSFPKRVVRNTGECSQSKETENLDNKTTHSYSKTII